MLCAYFMANTVKLSSVRNTVWNRLSQPLGPHLLKGSLVIRKSKIVERKAVLPLIQLMWDKCTAKPLEDHKAWARTAELHTVCSSQASLCPHLSFHTPAAIPNSMWFWPVEIAQLLTESKSLSSLILVLGSHAAMCLLYSRGHSQDTGRFLLTVRCSARCHGHRGGQDRRVSWTLEVCNLVGMTISDKAVGSGNEE